MKEIIRFVYNNKILCLIDKNEELKYGTIVNDEVTFSITEEEKNIIQEVFIRVLPMHKSIDLGYFEHNNKKFKHYIDKINGLHSFYEEKDNKLIIPNSADLKLLNLMFNNQNEYVNTHNGLTLEDINNYKRIVRFGKQFIVVFISTIVSLSLYTSIFPNAQIPFIANAIAYTENYDNLDAITKINNIISTIENNPSLSREEKELFLSSPEFIEDGINYFKYGNVIDFMERLNVEYIPTPSPDGKSASFVFTGPRKGTLKVYNSTSFADAPKWKMTHEFGHAFTSYENFSYGKGFYEIINTIMNNEYFGENNKGEKEIYDSSYSWLRAYAYMICSTLEEEDLRSYHATANPDIIVSALCKIIPDEDKAIRLLTYFDFLIDNIAYRKDTNEIYVPDSIIKEFGETRNNLNELAKEYYEAKHNLNMEDDLFFQYWADRNVFYQTVADIYKLNPSAVRFLPKYTKVKKYKTFFTSKEDDEMIVMICDAIGLKREYYTKEELSSKGYTENEISHLFRIDDGRYELKIYRPLTYIECSLSPVLDNKISRLK